ncbi:hypothetical protein FRB98_003079, partial [Tulasnella sp. 332]
HFWEHPLSKFQGWIRLSAADTLTIIRQEHSNKADHSHRIRCLRHAEKGYRSPYSFQLHLRF